MKLPYILCAVLLAVGILGITGVSIAQTQPAQPWAVDSTPPFDDVPSDHWASQATHKLRDIGIVIGYPNGTFNDSKVDEVANVPPPDWTYQAVDTLQKAGIVIGYPDGTYGGRRAMTRYEFAVAIARLLPLLNSDTAKDKDLSALQQEVVTRLTQNPDALEALRWLLIEFRPELTKLSLSQRGSLDVPKALERIDGALKPPADGLK